MVDNIDMAHCQENRSGMGSLHPSEDAFHGIGMPMMAVVST